MEPVSLIGLRCYACTFYDNEERSSLVLRWLPEPLRDLCQQQMNLSGSVANELSAFCDDLPNRRKAEGEARSL